MATAQLGDELCDSGDTMRKDFASPGTKMILRRKEGVRAPNP
jgi:hypothetical protein